MLDRILIGSSAEPSDPNFKNVTLLLHGDGSNGAQNNTFIDSSTNNFTITRNGNTTQGSFSPYGSNWSNYFDGSGDYLTLSSNAAFGFGTGDFTVEFWVYLDALPSSGKYTLVDFRAAANAQTHTMYVNSSGYLGFFNGSTDVTSSSAPMSGATWTHIAYSRASGTLRIYVNGAQAYSASNSIDYQSSRPVTIGAAVSGIEATKGYISNFRILKGTGLYTSTFTPSTTPLTAITNTSLLTCAYNRFRDGSTNNFTITRNGDVKVTNFAPFAPSSSYSTTTNGGSAYFDGSGDYLSVARNSAFIPSVGDFTIEAWVYPTTSGSTRFIMGLLQQGVTGDWSVFLHTNDTLGFYAGGADSFGSTVTPYQWNHVAISRSGTTIYKCVNGSATTATFVNSLDSLTGYDLTIGADRVGSIPFQGWMTDARVVKGTAVYTNTTYTVPTAPISAITNTGLLSKFTNAAIFDNSMKNDLETVGNAQISTSVKKFGTGSMVFAGGAERLQLPITPELYLGTTYTIEAWIYPTTLNGYRPIFSETEDFKGGFANIAIYTYPNGSLNVDLRTATSGGITNITGAILSTNTWYHVALSVSAGSAKLFINGTQSGSTATFAEYPVAKTLYAAVGGWGNGWNDSGIPAQSWIGNIDDFRITKGVARYTANFTAPTAPFPNK